MHHSFLSIPQLRDLGLFPGSDDCEQSHYKNIYNTGFCVTYIHFTWINTYVCDF